jgi:phenylacetic acid degradation protein
VGWGAGGSPGLPAPVGAGNTGFLRVRPMPVYAFEGRTPAIGPGSHVHPSAEVIGQVTIGAGCWIGPGVCIRGDYCEILIGDRCSIEENCILHARPGERTVLGDDVTVGHGAILHTARVDDLAVIGMGAIVSDWAVVGRWAVVAEGCVVRNRQEIPAEAIAVGLPARVMGRVDEAYKERWGSYKAEYASLARRYAAEVRPVVASDPAAATTPIGCES